MSPELIAADRGALEKIVGQLEAAWNAMDGAAFAAPFADDADFVNIRGEHHRGKPAIAAGHTAIFKSIYAGSSVALTCEAARLRRHRRHDYPSRGSTGPIGAIRSSRKNADSAARPLRPAFE